MIGHEAPELRNDIVVSAQRQVSLQSVFQRLQPKCFEPRDLGLRESPLGDLD
jgi:hypothetical protein